MPLKMVTSVEAVLFNYSIEWDLRLNLWSLSKDTQSAPPGAEEPVVAGSLDAPHRVGVTNTFPLRACTKVRKPIPIIGSSTDQVGESRRLCITEEVTRVLAG